MKNFEKYIDEITYALDMLDCNDCKDNGCNHCVILQLIKNFKIFMQKDMKEWLLAEYQEPIKLSHDEYVILKNLNKKFEYIARDEFSCLDVFEKKPYLDGDYWSSTGHEYSIGVYNHLFQFIKFEDEPYEIAKLIADYEKENGNE